jgi:hypothetical protein
MPPPRQSGTVAPLTLLARAMVPGPFRNHLPDIRGNRTASRIALPLRLSAGARLRQAYGAFPQNPIGSSLAARCADASASVCGRKRSRPRTRSRLVLYFHKTQNCELDQIGFARMKMEIIRSRSRFSSN